MSLAEVPAQVTDEGSCTNKWTLISPLKESIMQDFHNIEKANALLQSFKCQDNSSSVT